MKFWVGLKVLGLGFHRRRWSFTGEKREVRRRKRNVLKKWLNRAKNLLYKRWTGWVLTRSSALRLETVGSRSWWIWINPTPLRRSGDPDPSSHVGLGRVDLGFLVSFVLLEFFAILTPVLATWTPVHSNFPIKNSKNCYVFLILSLTVLWYFYVFKIDKNNMC